MVSSPRKLDGEAKQILVQLEDGSTWRAELEAGELVLIDQLTDPSAPTPTPSPEPTPEPEESEMGEESESEPEPSESEADEPEDETDAYDKMFDERPESKKLSETLSEQDNVSGLPDEFKGIVKDHAFRARLSSVMLDNKYDRRLRGRTRGKLDMGRLPKVPMMQRNVFMKKQARQGKRYNVLLLVDESGSMAGGKSNEAANSTLFLLSQMDGLNINTAVIGFNQAIMVHKAWGKKADYPLIHEAIASRGRADPWKRVSNTGYNNDYDAMHFAFEYFKKAEEGQNILIMLSDGEPATAFVEPQFVDEKGLDMKFTPHDMGGYEKDSKPKLHRLVDSYPNVHAVGIGIFEGGWQIPEHFIIHKLPDLKPAIIKALSKKIKRG